jgi:REP element-mobilizing transposase RayT
MRFDKVSSKKNDMDIRNQKLEKGHYYHIFNRGINSCFVFQNKKNKAYFLSKMQDYLADIAEIAAFCLMDTHFHILIRVKEEYTENFSQEKGLHSSESVVSKQIGKLISSYTFVFNKMFNRHGSLFESPFKRKKIESEEYLRNLILYIHLNPENTLKEVDFKTYEFSSYRVYILGEDAQKQELLELLFFDKDNFEYVHNNLKVSNFEFLGE